MLVASISRFHQFHIVFFSVLVYSGVNRPAKRGGGLSYVSRAKRDGLVSVSLTNNTYGNYKRGGSSPAAPTPPIYASASLGKGAHVIEFFSLFNETLLFIVFPMKQEKA